MINAWPPPTDTYLMADTPGEGQPPREIAGAVDPMPHDLDENGHPTEPYAEVVPGLFQADTTYSPAELFAQGFDAVFDLCGIDRSDGLVHEAYVVHPIDDVPWLPDPGPIHELGERVAELVVAGKKVAVNCMSGLNRSGLLVGRALIALGHSPQEAVGLIRQARGPHALSHHHFRRFLLIDCSPRRLAARRHNVLAERPPLSAGEHQRRVEERQVPS
jgi:hypothetical protein